MNMKDDFTRPLYGREEQGVMCKSLITCFQSDIIFLRVLNELVMGETELATIISILQHFDYVWVRIRESVISDL